MDQMTETELAEAPRVRIIGVHASDTYLVVEWFARLSVASTWRRLHWFSQS